MSYMKRKRIIARGDPLKLMPKYLVNEQTKKQQQWFASLNKVFLKFYIFVVRFALFENDSIIMFLRFASAICSTYTRRQTPTRTDANFVMIGTSQKLAFVNSELGQESKVKPKALWHLYVRIGVVCTRNVTFFVRVREQNLVCLMLHRICNNFYKAFDFAACSHIVLSSSCSRVQKGNNNDSTHIRCMYIICLVHTLTMDRRFVVVIWRFITNAVAWVADSYAVSDAYISCTPLHFPHTTSTPTHIHECS